MSGGVSCFLSLSLLLTEVCVGATEESGLGKLVVFRSGAQRHTSNATDHVWWSRLRSEAMHFKMMLEAGGTAAQCMGKNVFSSERNTSPVNANVYYWSKTALEISKCWCVMFLTSVGPAYIMGEGKMATTVEAGSSRPSSSTAACCLMRHGSGTSSSLVQPPRGCSSSTGRR